MIGAPLDNNGGGVDAGAAYIFTRSGGVWIQQQKLTATDGTAGDAFGFSLALSGNTVLVSAYEDDNTGGVNAGSAYVFVPDVPNAAPVVNAGPDQLATEDVPFNLVASFTDADIADTHIATVNWGDGSPAQVTIVTEPSGSNAGTLNASHTYLASGSYQVTVTVTDAANAAAFDTLQVTVTEAISANYILNTTTQQPNANFNISGNGVIGGNLSVNGALNADGSTLTNLYAANIASGTLDNARLGLISAPNIADSAINTPQIADSAVTVAKIASNQVVKNLNGLTDSVNLQAGENVTITPSGNTLTIAAAGGASQWTSSGSNISYNSGNVGIGSLSPESLLHLTGPSGVAAITINTPGNQRFRFQTLPGIPNWGGLTLNANFQSESGWVLDEPASNGWFLKLDNRGANGASPLNGLWLWRIPPGAGLHTETPQFGVTNGQGFFAGNLGIGTTSPMSKLHVVGDGKFTGTISIDGNVQLNSLGTAGSNHLCRNSFNQLAACSSSYRYKMNIMPFSLGLSLVRRMRPITFDWKADGMNDIGFGAEDVALVEPLLATYNAKGEVEGVKYDRISAVLINAIKEQQAQIEAQQLQLQRQQKLINGLKNLLCKNDPNADVCR